MQGKRDECYETRLRIQRVELNDGRHYYLTVENEKGSDSFYVTLNVKEPIPMATVIAVGIACLFVIIVVTLCLLYAYRSERCCFNHHGERFPEGFTRASIRRSPVTQDQ